MSAKQASQPLAISDCPPPALEVDDDLYPEEGDFLQVAFDTNPDVWCRCLVQKLDKPNKGFLVKYGGSGYFLPIHPHESWRACSKEVDLKVKLTQEERNLVAF